MSQVTIPKSNSKVNEVQNVIHQNGKLFLKTFLIDDTLNKLGWKMDPSYIDRYINTAIGRPAILNQIHYHPLEYNHIVGANSPDPYIQAQEPYRIGTIKQLYQGSIPHSWSALIEITDPRVVKAYEDGSLKIPRYVSPAVYELNPSANPSKEIKDYEFLHLAFVDTPAFGTVKANIRGECKGTEQICMNHLAQAAIDTSIHDCNFCPVAELNKFTNTLDASVDANSSYVTTDTKSIHPELSSNNSTNENKQIDAPISQQPTQEVKATTTAVAVPETNKEQAEIRSPIKVVQTPTQTEVTNTNKEENKPEDQQQQASTLKVEISATEELKQQLEILSKELAELKADKEAREKAEIQTREQAKRSLIEKYVTPDSVNGNEEERERRIKAFMNIPTEELEYFLSTHYILPAAESPCSGKVKQAGVKRVTDYSKKEVPAQTTNNTNVKQAGIMIDEETEHRLKTMSKFITMGLSSSNAGSRFS